MQVGLTHQPVAACYQRLNSRRITQDVQIDGYSNHANKFDNLWLEKFVQRQLSNIGSRMVPYFKHKLSILASMLKPRNY